MYALLFSDHGLSDGAVSSLFIIWSVTTFVVEVPSGAWADMVDRRCLLVASGCAYVAAFTCWTLAGGYAGFAAGFVLWGVSSALMSGTFEALLYDELAALGATHHYAQLLGWSRAASTVAAVAGIALAGPLYAWGGYGLVGFVSIAAAGVHTALAWTLPATPNVTPARTEQPASAMYVALLRDGVGEALREPIVSRMVAVLGLVCGIMAYDEYFPLIAREHGASTAAVPLLMAVIAGGEAIGNALAGRGETMSAALVGVFVVASAALVSFGALSAHLAGMLAIAAGYGLLSNVVVVLEARLQAHITGPARATVTSVAGFLAEVAALSVYASFAIGSRWMSVATMVAMLGVPTLFVAVIIVRSPRQRARTTGSPADG